MNAQYNAMVRQTARQREQQQQLARPSRVRIFVTVTGIGETRLVGSNAIDFGSLLLEEPTFSFGVRALSDVPTGAVPLATATVLSYKENAKGLYTGANLAFRVDSIKYDIKLRFSLTFEGVAMRLNLPTSIPVSDIQARR